MKYRHLIQDSFHKNDGLISSTNELGRIAKGLKGGIKGTDTIFFVHKHQVPKGRSVTYAPIVCSVRPEKEEQKRTWNSQNPLEQ